MATTTIITTSTVLLPPLLALLVPTLWICECNNNTIVRYSIFDQNGR